MLSSRCGAICDRGDVPYVIRNRPYNSAEYIRLLTEEVFPDIQGFIGQARWARRLGCRQGSNLFSHFFWKQIDTHVFNAGWGALTHKQCDHGFLGPGVWGQASVRQVFKILVQFCLLFIPTSGQFKDRIGPLTLPICHLATFSCTVISR